MPPGGGQEKTEKATPKKRKDAREKEGNVLQSKEITTGFSILFVFFALYVLGKYMYRQLIVTTADWLNRIGDEFTVSGEFLTNTGITIAANIAMIILPLCLIAGAVPVLVVLVQTKGLFTMKPLKPKFSKMNPINGFKRLFSFQSTFKVIVGLIELSAIGAIVFTRVRSSMMTYQRLPDMEIIQAVSFIAREAFFTVMMIVMVFFFVSVLDYIFQWWQYEKKLKMSKQEVKDEYKQIEGDPLIKSKIKQKQREVAQQRMMDGVGGSDVVVRNPTHYAVALAYDKENTAVAPKVVAKGKDALAMKIIGLAEKHEVYITENRPLARELYDTVEVGREIPPSLYNAIAIILTDMYQSKGITVGS